MLPAAGPALEHPEASARQNLAPNTKWDNGGSTVETLLLSHGQGDLEGSWCCSAAAPIPSFHPQKVELIEGSFLPG